MDISPPRLARDLIRLLIAVIRLIIAILTFVGGPLTTISAGVRHLYPQIRSSEWTSCICPLEICPPSGFIGAC
jgi:hypothetical protein